MATSSPIVNGAMPLLNARTPSVWRRAAPQRVAHSASVVEGSMMPASAAKAPANPATFQPSTATKSTFGPGAAWASATEALNWASVIQCCSITR